MSGDMIPVDQIVENDLNPWHGRSDVTDLAASISRHGVLQPVLLRPLASGMLRLVHGHRRFRGSKLAGLTEIPANVREMTDEEELELAVVENVQRADLHPVDEGEMFSRMHRDYGWTVDQIGMRIGKSRAWVYERMRLADLDEDVKKAAYDKRITAGVASLLTGLPKSRQTEMLGMVAADENYDEPMTVRDAKELIESHATAHLDKAGWPMGLQLKEANGTKLPKCDGCMYRAPVPGEDGNGRCLDVSCFERKSDVWIQREIDCMVSKGAKRLSEKEVAEIAPHGYVNDRNIVDLTHPLAWFEGITITDEILQQLGDALFPLLRVGLNRKGGVARYADRSSLRELLTSRGLIEAGEEQDDEGHQDEDEQEGEEQGETSGGDTYQRRAERRRRVEAALPAIVQHVSESPRDRPFWLGLSEMILEDALCADSTFVHDLVDAREWKPQDEEEIDRDDVIHRISLLTEGQVAAVCFELLARMLCGQGEADIVQRSAERLGLDVEAIAASVQTLDEENEDESSEDDAGDEASA